MSSVPEPKATILNVDDNDGSLYVKTRILRHAGFQVIEADRGSRVIPLIQTHQPDLVLLDVNLPDANGIDVCRAIKSDPDLASTIVVQMSASFVDREARLQGLQAGADSYFTEPMEAEELVANISALLRIRKMERELRRSAIEWKKTFEAVHEGVAIVQETGVITRCNPAFDRMTGHSSVDHRIDDVLGTKDGLVRSMLEAAAQQASPSTIEIEVRDRSMRLSVDPVLDAQGQVTHFACILSDVTAERQIANLNKQLSLTVDHLKHANEVADAASRSKDDFLATLSHELRTPMTAIIGWAQMLKMFGPERDMTQGINAILSAARAQSQLVEDLLDLSRVTTGKLRLEMETLDFAEAVDAAIQTIVPAAMAKRIDLQKRLSSAQILGDRNRVQQVAWNLLSNAVKFTPDGGTIAVDLEIKGPRAILSVRDSGQGIDPSFLNAIFDRFTQADPATRVSGAGLGLGLAIVRHIVEMHGGQVTAESAGKGKGATFRVAIPLLQK